MAYSKIIHTKSEASGAIPAESSLSYGEIAINYSDGHLYIKNANNEIKKVASSDFPVQIGGLIADVKSLTNSINFINLQFRSADDLDFGRNNINSVRTNNSLTYGLSNEVGSSSENSLIFGIRNKTTGKKAIAIGDNNVADGENSISIGSYVKTPSDVAEFGNWTNVDSVLSRVSSVRLANKNVAMTLLNSSTKPAAGGALGEELAVSLPEDMYAIRRHVNEIFLDVNIGGTVQTCSFGDSSTSPGQAVLRYSSDAASGTVIEPVTSIRHVTQAQYTELSTTSNVDAGTLYIVND